jgi:hypothetical protein
LQPQSGPQAQALPAGRAIGGAVVAWQPHSQAVLMQSAHRHEKVAAVAAKFMEIS